MIKTLAGFAALLLVLSLGEAAFLHWGWLPLDAWRQSPRVEFEPQAPLAADAYDNPNLWIAHPALQSDPSRNLPPGVRRERAGRAYVFAVHPTTFFARSHWNAPFDHTNSQMRATLAVRAMGSAFSEEAAVFAPRYRQAARGVFLADSPDADRALAAAEDDVAKAFATFARAVPPGAPIVLAGEGQGTLILLRLLARPPVRATLQRRLIAAYFGGWPVSAKHDLPSTGLPLCQARDQAGCAMVWSSFAEPADPREFAMMTQRYPALDGNRRDDAPMACTNPLTGGGGASAPPAQNAGSLAMGDEIRQPALVRPSVGARCDPASGLLLVTAPPHLGDQIMFGNDYTAYDFALFWANLRGDVARREAYWAAGAKG